MQAGLELFGTDGFAATSVAAVCARAALSTRSFYEHFDDREALLAEIYDSIIEILAERLDDALSESQDLPTMCQAAAAAIVDVYVNDERLARIVCREVVGVSPVLQERRRAAQMRFQSVLQSQVKRIAPTGQLSAVDLGWTLVWIIGAVGEIFDIWLELTRRPSPRRLTAEIGRLMYAGLTAPALELPEQA